MSSASSNTNSGVRDVQEGTNRLSEDATSAGHSIKRTIFGGSETKDKASEASNHASNRVGEVANRVGDSISSTFSSVKESLTGTAAKTDEAATSESS